MRMTLRMAALSALAGLLAQSAAARAADILFIGGETAPGVFNAADTAMIARLSGVLGHSVLALDDGVALPSDGVGRLTIISSTSGSNPIKNQWNSSGPVGAGGDGALLRNSALPVLNFENGLADELGYMNAGAGQGIWPNAGSSYPAAGVDINILLPAHPLAAGLGAGFQSVLTAPATLTSHGNTLFGGGIPASADIVAKFTSTPLGFGATVDANHTAILVLEVGDAFGTAVADPDYSATANGRRIGMFMDDNNFTSLNANGLALFDAAVGYGVAAVPEPSTVALAGVGLAMLTGMVLRRRVRTQA